MLIEYLEGKTTSNIDIFTTLVIMFAAVTAGQTISNFNHDFLKLLTTPVFQFIIYYIILQTVYRNDPSVTTYDLIIETVLFVIIVQAAKYIIDYLMNK